MTTLKEILDMKALPFDWINENQAIFKLGSQRYGIFVEYLELQLVKRKIDIANISFGRIGDQFKEVSDLDTSLTKLGKPRTIMSTVAEACLSNNELTNCDVIALAAADQASAARIMIYSLATAEIKLKRPEYRKKDIELKTETGSRIILLAKTEFTALEVKQISQKLKLDKI
jgi:hypothetical protein